MVVMGVVKGRPNYLEHVGLDDDFAPVHGDFSKPQDPDQIAWVVFDVLMMLLALGNLSAGRADFRNALRFALLIGGLYATMELLVTTLGDRYQVRVRDDGAVVGLWRRQDVRSRRAPVPRPSPRLPSAG